MRPTAALLLLVMCSVLLGQSIHIGLRLETTSPRFVPPGYFDATYFDSTYFDTGGD